jgi:hypothetical protein
MPGTYTLESKPLGYRQLSVSTDVVDLSDATGGIPAGATRALVNVAANDVRWRDDEGTPSATVGILQKADTFINLPSLQSINGFRAIRASADAVLNIAYYGS